MISCDIRLLKWSRTFSDIPQDDVLTVKDRMDEIFSSWEGTPYGQGQQAKGRVVDCVRFVTGVLDELYKTDYKPTFKLPQDTAFHNAKSCVHAMNQIIDLYGGKRLPPNRLIEPGDILITGAYKGGPGHAMIAGTRQSHIWHIDSHSVSRTGIGFTKQKSLYHLYRIYRVPNKHLWI